MNITITGRHLDITQALRDHVTEGFRNLGEHFKKDIQSVEVVLKVERENQTAEATMHIARWPALHAEASSSDMYASIDMMIDKMKTQIQRHKEKEIDERNHGEHGE